MEPIIDSEYGNVQYNFDFEMGDPTYIVQYWLWQLL